MCRRRCCRSARRFRHASARAAASRRMSCRRTCPPSCCAAATRGTRPAARWPHPTSQASAAPSAASLIPPTPSPSTRASLRPSSSPYPSCFPSLPASGCAAYQTRPRSDLARSPPCRATSASWRCACAAPAPPAAPPWGLRRGSSVDPRPSCRPRAGQRTCPSTPARTRPGLAVGPPRAAQHSARAPAAA